MVKNRLYNKKRNFLASQFTIYHCLLEIIKLYAPFIPFLTEELYKEYFKKFEKKKSVHLLKISSKEKNLSFSQAGKEIDKIIEIIYAVRKFKSENKLSLSQKISLIEIETKQKNIKKYFEIIKDTLMVHKINKGKGNIKVNDYCSIKISI